ncbi:MAG TPA: universal stress protein [Acidimicrobiales bacterium]|nr:universal stress protein [Acidimicrobiales bacterium]
MTAPSLRMVVGFDGSEGSQKALLWAAEEARLRGAKVDVVRAWSPGEFGSDEEFAHIVDKKLEEDVHSLLGSDPGFEFKLVVQRGRPATVLMDLAKEAQILVVGSRGHGGFAGLLLGSVSQQVTTHASAPVVVVVKN